VGRANQPTDVPPLCWQHGTPVKPKPPHLELDLGEGRVLALDGEAAPDEWSVFSNNGLLPMGNTRCETLPQVGYPESCRDSAKNPHKGRKIHHRDAENIDETTNKGSNHPKEKGKNSLLPPESPPSHADR
jgi:hypothetical protein